MGRPSASCHCAEDADAPYADALPSRSLCAAGQQMQLFVRVLDGRTLAFHLGRHQPLALLKARLAAEEGVAAADQRLVWGGRQLLDSCTPVDANLQSGATLHLLLRLRGGIFVETCELLWGLIKQICQYIRDAWNWLFGKRCCVPPPPPPGTFGPKRYGPCWCPVPDDDSDAETDESFEDQDVRWPTLPLSSPPPRTAMMMPGCGSTVMAGLVGVALTA
jgi:hypothetical protein